MKDYRLILELGTDDTPEVPAKIHTDIKAASWHDASVFADKAYPASEGWVVVDIVEIMGGLE